MDSPVGLVRLSQNVYESFDATCCGFASVDLDPSSSATSLLGRNASQCVQLILTSYLISIFP